MIDTGPRVLEIFILPHCFASEAALHLAERVQATFGDTIVVRLVDLSNPDTHIESDVFAVPTYVLNGRRLCLGNPDEAWLMLRLAQERHEV